MNINKKDVVKRVAAILGGAGTGVIVKSAVDHVLPGNLGKIDRLCVMIGRVALAGSLGSVVSSQLEKDIDDIDEFIKTGKMFGSRIADTLSKENND